MSHSERFQTGAMPSSSAYSPRNCYANNRPCSKSRTLLFLLVFLNAITALAIPIHAITTSAEVEFSQRATKLRPCERISVKNCLGIGYNYTRFPNLLGQETSETAADDFATFEPLIGFKCSEELRFFLCSVYFPMCTEKVPISIGPCQPLCRRVETSCTHVLRDFGFPWPSSLNCSQFPSVNSDETMCMDSSSRGESLPPPRKKEQFLPTQVRTEYFSLGWERDVNYVEELRKYVLPGQTCLLPTSMVYVNRTAMCIPYCHSTHGYKQSELASAESFIVIVSALNLSISAISVLLAIVTWNCVHQRGARASQIARTTYEIYMSRSGGRRALVYTSAGFATNSAVVLVNLLAKDAVACATYNRHLTWLISVEVFVIGSGVPHIPCTLAATLLFFTATASRLWWVLLPCYSNRRKVNSNGTSASQDGFHAAAWGIPVFLCTIALMTKDAISGDPLTSVCLVGGTVRVYHQAFVVARDMVLVLVALLIFAASCLPQKSGSKEGGLKQRTNSGISVEGAIGLLYPVTAACWLGVYVHCLTTQANAKSLAGWNFANIYKSSSDPCFGILFGCVHFIYLVYCLLTCEKRENSEGRAAGQHHRLQRLNDELEVPMVNGLDQGLLMAADRTCTMPASSQQKGNLSRTTRIMEVSIGESRTQSIPLPPPPSQSHYEQSSSGGHFF